ncbi:MAG: MazG family protein [Thermodesulfobacteriota bacterium]|jgi:MazG family protein|nr:MAG: MazG family protein [Thermodesulfobacteriota bacterium]
MEKAEKLFRDLVFLIRTLRGDGGCPWDRKQTIETLKYYLQEEFQEFIEALEKKSPEKIQEEMGDLIFLLLFCAEIARDEGNFSIGDVLENVKKKMVGRHPHVFEGREANNIFEIRENWQEIKKKEKVIASQRTLKEKLPRHLPVLLQVYWLTKRLGESTSPLKVMEKMEAETTKLKKELIDENQEMVKQCLGDIFLDLVNLSRFIKVNPEALLRESLMKRIQENFGV